MLYEFCVAVGAVGTAAFWLGLLAVFVEGVVSPYRRLPALPKLWATMQSKETPDAWLVEWLNIPFSWNRLRWVKASMALGAASLVLRCLARVLKNTNPKLGLNGPDGVNLVLQSLTILWSIVFSKRGKGPTPPGHPLGAPTAPEPSILSQLGSRMAGHVTASPPHFGGGPATLRAFPSSPASPAIPAIFQTVSTQPAVFPTVDVPSQEPAAAESLSSFEGFSASGDTATDGGEEDVVTAGVAGDPSPVSGVPDADTAAGVQNRVVHTDPDGQSADAPEPAVSDLLFEGEDDPVTAAAPTLD